MHSAAAIKALVFMPFSWAAAEPTDRSLQPPAHAEQVEYYAAAMVGAQRAEQVCNGYRIDHDVSKQLRAMMAIGVEDEQAVSKWLQAYESKVSSQLEAIGTEAWCKAIIDLFGPKGTLAPGLLAHRR
jgi:hypothetical protein